MKWYGSRVLPIVPQNRFGVAVLLLCYHNSTANQIWGRGTFITCGTFIRYLRVVAFIGKSFMPLEICVFSSFIYTWRTTICIKKDVAMLILCYFCYYCTVLQSLFYWQFWLFLSLKMGEETQKLWRTSKSVGSPPPAL